MRTFISIFVILCSFSFSVFGSAVFDSQTGVLIIDGTNTVQIAWGNPSLSTSDKAFFLADFEKVVAPCASDIVIGNGYADFLRDTATPIPIGWSYDMWAFPTLERIEFPEIPILGMSNPELELTGEGTNYVLRFSKPILDRIPIMHNIANTYSNEIAAATAFVDNLRDNLNGLSNEEVANLRLTTAYAPGACPTNMAESVKRMIAGTPYPPPLLGFATLPYGPSGQDVYLWGQVPVTGGQYGVTFIPIIYYSGKWWISTWFLESDGQVW